MPTTRTPEEIRRSIESNRAELALSLSRLRGEVAEVTDWRKQIVRHRKQVVFVAGFLAIALGPPVDFLQRLGLKRSFAIILVYLGIAASIFGVGLLIVPPVVDQVNGLSKDIPGYVKDLRKSKT